LTIGGLSGKRTCVAIKREETNALRLLLKEELEIALQPLREELNTRFDKIGAQIDGLYQRDERRAQEYLSIREQIRRLESTTA